jgi:hypothetical protein
MVGGSPLREAIFGTELSNWLISSPSISTVYCWPIVRISMSCQTPFVSRSLVFDCNITVEDSHLEDSTHSSMTFKYTGSLYATNGVVARAICIG